jgi:hypothetical protein
MVDSFMLKYSLDETRSLLQNFKTVKCLGCDVVLED